MDVVDPPAAVAATSSAHAQTPRRSQRRAAPAQAAAQSKAESAAKEDSLDEQSDGEHLEEAGEEEEDVDIMNSPLQRPWGAQVGLQPNVPNFKCSNSVRRC